MIYRFNAFELDRGRFELRHAGKVRALTRKSFDLLHYLVEHAGRVVTKQEIFARIWKDENVGPSVLPVHVRTIRRALGVESSQAILGTVRGRGYMITCTVERLNADATTSTAGFRGSEEMGPLHLTRSSMRDPLRALAQVSGMLALALGLGELGLARDSLELLGHHSLLANPDTAALESEGT